MADSALFQCHTIIENKALKPQIHRRKRATEHQSPLVCLASFSQLSTSTSYTRQPTRICVYSPVTSGASSSSSPSSSRISHVVTLRGTRMPSSSNIPANRVDQLLRNLSISQQQSASDGLELACSLPNEVYHASPTTLLRATKRLSYSNSVEKRYAGYKLVESICHTQGSLSAVEAVSLWEIIRRAGLEVEAVARNAQLEALDAWVSRYCVDWSVCGIMDLVLSWHKVAIRSQSMGIKSFNKLHQILRTIIKSKPNRIESHMAELFQLYHSAIQRAIDIPSSATSTLQHKLRLITITENVVDKSNGPPEHFPFEDASFMLLELLDCIRCEVLSTTSIPIVMASLSQILGYIPQGNLTSLSASTMQALQSMLVDEAYGQLAIETLEDIWAANIGDHDYRIALGALRAAKQIIIDCLSERIGYNAPLEEPSKHGPETSMEVDRMIRALIGLPDTWMVREGGDDVLVELVDLVEEVMTQFRYGRRSEISAFVGHVIFGLTGKLDLYWHTYKLSILEHSAAPTPIIAALEKLLRSARNDAVMQPPLNSILLLRTQHLTDSFLHDLIIQLQRSRQLEPSSAAWKWQDNIRTLLGHFSTAFVEYPRARRAFVEHLSNVYIHDAYAEIFHTGIAGDIITTLEKILPKETDEIVIKAGFDICLKELILSHEDEEIPRRIRAIWMRLALEDHPLSFRRVRAVKFFIIGFKKFAFRPPQSLKIVDGKDDWRQSASAAAIAISLYRDIVSLAGLSRDDEGQVQGPLLLCPEARLVILQWLLRLRAGATHRIFAVDGPLTEVIPLATLAHRVQGGNEQSIQVPLEKEFKMTSSPAMKRIRPRRTTGSSTPRTGSAVLDMIIDQAVQLVSPQERDGGTFDINLPSPASESPLIATGPSTRQLWSLPDRVRADLFVGTDVPSPAMITFQTNEQSGYWLHVDSYVTTLADILEYDDDWEIVSYVLCHLPLQLANKHFWCGPKVASTIRRLPIAICKGVNDNQLWKRLSDAGTMNIGAEDVQAMLYHTLMVLIAYRKRFSLDESQLDDIAKIIVDDVIKSFMQGLGTSLVTTRLSLEGLSLIVYAMPEVLRKFSAAIVEKISRITTNPDLAIPILEFLLVLGFGRKTWLNFRPIDHQTVFSIALMYIEQHYKSGGGVFHNMGSKESFSLNQHILHTAFAVIHAWFLRMKPEDRAQYIPFISRKLMTVNRRKDALEPMVIVSLDFLARYAYANVDSKRSFSFMYKSIICPDVPDEWQNLRKPWRARQDYETKNVAKVEAFKFGPSIITVSVMKEPKNWIRLVLRRPSCHIEMVCRLEGNSSICAAPIPELELGRDTSFIEGTLDISESLFGPKDLNRPDPVSGLSWSMDNDYNPEQHVVNPAMLTPLLASFSGDPSEQLQKFPDYSQLINLLELLDSTPVIATYKVAVLYVAPGQSEESEILANRHGSPAYTRFIQHLGRVVTIRDELEANIGGLEADKHGDHGLAWWDDICEVLYHVATFMPNFDVPNMSKTFWKKAEIGNIAVKIIWNDSGAPFKRETIAGDFNFFNIIIEPHTMTPEAAYQKNFHIQGFFKVLLQSDPSLPRITPTGEFKIVAINDLPQTISNFAFIACLFCQAWTDTVVGEGDRIPLNTNWQQRLSYITKLSRFLPNEPEAEYSTHGLPVSTRDVSFV